MNLIEENFQNKEEKKKKRVGTIILIAIFLVIIIIIAIVSYLMYLKSQVLTLTLDGVQNEKIKQILVFEEDGTIYVPIKEIASYFGYESYNGEYNQKSEIQSKCYVQSKNEIANFELGQTKIYKIDLTNGQSNYEYVYMKKPVKAIGGVLYATTEGIEKAFNVSFNYNNEENTITILTMPYLYSSYANIILDYGYVELSEELANQKAILEDKLVVLKDNTSKQYGVIKANGEVILEPKYDNITYLQNTGDFLVETGEKVGILSPNRETRVPIMYDSIELLDSDYGLYIAEKDNKYGVIDIKGGTKIYIENDQIGYDISNFKQNNIKSKYVLAGGLIPVKKNNYWALYDINGKQLTDYKYDSLGYVASSNKDAINLLVIPNYDVLVVCKDKKYTLLNSTGSELFAIIADDIYMIVTGGETYYYITVNDQKMDAIEYLNRNGITARQSSTQNQNEVVNAQDSENANTQEQDNQNANNEQQQNQNTEDNQEENSNVDNEQQSNQQNDQEEEQNNNQENQQDNSEEQYNSEQQENNNEE